MSYLNQLQGEPAGRPFTMFRCRPDCCTRAGCLKACVRAWSTAATNLFAGVGFSPALTQVAYRIGDSSTNIISPLSYYLPVMLGLLEQYKPKEDTKVGIGTVISLAMPYSLFYLAGFTLLLVVWYLLGLPLGPATPVALAM